MVSNPKILIAMDSFKESMSAEVACNAVRDGMQRVLKDATFDCVPVGDGGEGTTEALLASLDGEWIEHEVHDALFRPIQTAYGWIPQKHMAIIEVAHAAGLEQLAMHERNPLKTTSFGVGELLKDALERGAQEVIIGLGGSATNDGAMGIFAALGAKFLDKGGKSLLPVGASLLKIAKIDTRMLDKRLANLKITLACDVDSPLHGAQGAAHTFARQKGADDASIKHLDAGLAHFAQCLKADLGIDVATKAGAGAAGGIGGGMMAFCPHAQVKSGISVVLHAVDFAKRLEGVNYVITGEGRIDGQTASGKTPVGVALAAQKQDCTVIVLAGAVGEGAEAVYEYGIDAYFSVVNGAISLEEALKQGEVNLANTAENLARLIQNIK